MPRRTRTLALAALCLILALPLQAERAPARPSTSATVADFFFALFERLGAPLTSLWATEDTRGTLDPFGTPAPPPGGSTGSVADPGSESDTRGTLDPFG
jgi:hypothetical protein